MSLVHVGETEESPNASPLCGCEVCPDRDSSCCVDTSDCPNVHKIVSDLKRTIANEACVCELHFLPALVLEF